MNTLILPVKSNLQPKTPIKSSQALEHHDIVAASHLLTAISYGLNINEESIMEDCSGEILTYFSSPFLVSKVNSKVSVSPEPGGTSGSPENTDEGEDRPGGPLPKAPEPGGTSGSPENTDEGEDRPGGAFPEANEPNIGEEVEDRSSRGLPKADD